MENKAVCAEAAELAFVCCQSGSCLEEFGGEGQRHTGQVGYCWLIFM